MSEQEYYPILTKAGKAKEMACLAGETEYDIREIAVGDGNGSLYEPEETQTALKNECWRGLVDKCENEGETRYAIVHIPANVGGFTIREIGAFDKEGNLLIIAKCAENYKRLPSTGDIKQLSIRLDLSVINELVLPFLIDPSVNTATVEYCDKHYQKLNEKGKASGYAPLDKNILLPYKHLPFNHTPFAVNNGLSDENGNPAFVTVNFDNTLLTLKSPITYTTASGATASIDEDLTLDISDIEEGDYTLILNHETKSLELTNAGIMISENFPSNAKDGDYCFNFGVEPYQTYKLVSSVWTKCDIIRIATISQSTIKPFDFNDNGINLKNSSDFELLDFKLTDHVISDETWALMGSELSKEQYPSTYSLLLDLYNSGTDSSDNNVYIDVNTLKNKVITYKKAFNGKKITSGQSANLDELFIASGSSWYYQIDTVNEKFTLPRSNNYFQLLTGTSGIGDFVEAGIPNLMGSLHLNVGGAAADTKLFNIISTSAGSLLGGSTGLTYYIAFNANNYNKFYGNSSVVQTRANKMLLYFKVK